MILQVHFKNLIPSVLVLEKAKYMGIYSPKRWNSWNFGYRDWMVCCFNRCKFCVIFQYWWSLNLHTFKFNECYFDGWVWEFTCYDCPKWSSLSWMPKLEALNDRCFCSLQNCLWSWSSSIPWKPSLMDRVFWWRTAFHLWFRWNCLNAC